MKSKNLNLIFRIIPLIAISLFNTPASDAKNVINIDNKTILIGVPNNIFSMKPTDPVSFHTRLAHSLVFEQLVRINKSQQLEPVLAKSWSFSPNQKSIEITIAKNHNFSDGSPVTPEDIVSSIKRACNSKVSSENFFIQGIIGCTEGGNAKIYVAAENKVKVHLNINPTIFLYQLTDTKFSIFKMRNERPIGSGAYKISKQSKDALHLEKNRFYHKLKKVKNQKVVVLKLSDPNLQKVIQTNSRFDALLIYRPQYSTKDLVVKNSHYSEIDDNTKITSILMLNNKRFPFNKRILRKALASQIYNSNELVKCSNNAQKAYGIIPKGLGGSIAQQPPQNLPIITPETVFKKIPQLKLKTNKAIFHRHIGRKNNCETNILKNIFSNYNIDLSFSYHNTYETLYPLYLNHNLDGFIEFYVFYKREAFSILRIFHSKNPFNRPNLPDSVLDSYIMSLWEAHTPSERFLKYRQSAQYIQDQALVIPIFYSDHKNYVNTCLDADLEAFKTEAFYGIMSLERTPRCYKTTKQ